MVTETPRGATALQWMNNYPGADMLRVRGAFGVESVVLVSPAAMRDVLSANSEDFEKPWVGLDHSIPKTSVRSASRQFAY